MCPPLTPGPHFPPHITMTAQSLTDDLLEKVGGENRNNLNSILELSSRHDDQTQIFNFSSYYDIESLTEILQNSDEKFITISLNIESINAKFNQLTSFLNYLDENMCNVDAVFLQETWLTEQQCTSKIIENYRIPGYHTVPLGRTCGRKGGLITYLRDCYNFTHRDIYTPSLH